MQQIEAYHDADISVKKKRREVKRNIALLDDIIKSGSISNAPFCQHYDEYDGIENLKGK